VESVEMFKAQRKEEFLDMFFEDMFF